MIELTVESAKQCLEACERSLGLLETEIFVKQEERRRLQIALAQLQGKHAPGTAGDFLERMPQVTDPVIAEMLENLSK